MTENLATEFDAPVKRSLNRKKVTMLGAAAVGVAVLALVINDQLKKRGTTVDPTELVES